MQWAELAKCNGTDGLGNDQGTHGILFTRCNANTRVGRSRNLHRPWALNRQCFQKTFKRVAGKLAMDEHYEAFCRKRFSPSRLSDKLVRSCTDCSVHLWAVCSTSGSTKCMKSIPQSLTLRRSLKSAREGDARQSNRGFYLQRAYGLATRSAEVGKRSACMLVLRKGASTHPRVAGRLLEWLMDDFLSLLLTQCSPQELRRSRLHIPRTCSDL